MEEFINQRIEEEISKIKNKYISSGVEFTEKDEICMRYGMTIGIMIGGLGLIKYAPEPKL